MIFRLEYSSSSKNFLKKVDKALAKRILAKLEEVQIDPFHYLEHYEGRYYKLRIGNYRALVDMDFDKKILFVQVIDKRGRIYKRN